MTKCLIIIQIDTVIRTMLTTRKWCMATQHPSTTNWRSRWTCTYSQTRKRRLWNTSSVRSMMMVCYAKTSTASAMSLPSITTWTWQKRRLSMCSTSSRPSTLRALVAEVFRNVSYCKSRDCHEAFSARRWKKSLPTISRSSPRNIGIRSRRDSN